MAYQVDYDGYYGYIGGRPYADIECHGVAGRVQSPLRLSALIDTGADYLALPLSAAQALNINLSTYTASSVFTAGGYVSAVTIPSFSVEIEGKLVTVKAQFMAIPQALLGLQAFLTAIDIGLDLRKWLFKK